MSIKTRSVLRTLYFILCDVITICFAAYLPLAFRFGAMTLDQQYLRQEWQLLPIDIIIFLAINMCLKLYNRVWTYASIDEMRDSIISATLTEIAYIFYKTVFHMSLPKSFYPINWMVIVIMLCISRLSIRMIRRIIVRRNKSADRINVMVVGAGAAANALIHEMKFGPGIYKAVCLIDDNPTKHHARIQGIPVVGDRNYIEIAASKYSIDEIVIAIPSANPTTIREIIDICNMTKCKIKRLPAIATTVSGSLYSTVRDINYEDLLTRDSVIIKNPDLADKIKNATVMVTGGGGSIGSEIARQMVANKADRVVIVDNYENTAFELEQEVKRFYPDADFNIRIADVLDYDRMKKIFAEFEPKFIIHAAAHKHVPLMEDNPCEAIKNNCLGTLNICKLADKYGAERMILISTDKAVRPTNVMGASKRICEMIVQSWDKKSDTDYAAVRFGNVLGSNGSVIPLFLDQIEHGGPVTVTHREINRYFMTIPEAVSLVLAAGIMAKGGEIFVLDMGEPIKIYELACNLIRMKGYEPDKDIKIDIIGLRPGEKLYEEVLMDEEGLQDTENHKIKIGQPLELPSDIDEQVKKLIELAYKNDEEIRVPISKLVPEYKPKKIYVS